MGINDTSMDHVYDPDKNTKEKPKTRFSSEMSNWVPSSTIKPLLRSRPLTTYEPISSGYNISPSIRTSARKSSYGDLLNMSEKSDDEEESEELQLPTSEEDKEKCMLRFFQQAQKFYAKGVEPRESRLVDFPVFKGVTKTLSNG